MNKIQIIKHSIIDAITNTQTVKELNKRSYITWFGVQQTIRSIYRFPKRVMYFYKWHKKLFTNQK